MKTSILIPSKTQSGQFHLQDFEIDKDAFAPTIENENQNSSIINIIDPGVNDDFENQIDKINELVLKFKLKQFYQELEPLAQIKNIYQEIQKIKTFPELLNKYNFEQSDSAMDEIGEKLLLSDTIAADKINLLNQKLDQLHALKSLLENIIHAIININSKYILLSSKKSELSPIDRNKLKYVIETLQKLKDKIAGQHKHIENKLADIKDLPLRNSIIVRTWSDNKEREILGVPSGGHTTVELYKNRHEHIYLGFYVSTSINKSFIGQVFSKLGLPSPEVGKGCFVSLEQDKSMLKNGEYEHCEEIVIPCDQAGAELDFDAAYAWAQETLNRYEHTIPGTNKKIHIINDFRFFNNNCASLGAQALKQAGSEKFVKYTGVSIIDMDSPIGVSDYAKKLKLHREQLAEQYIHDSVQPIQQKYQSYIDLTIKRLALIQGTEIGSKTETILNDLITQLNQAINTIGTLADNKLNEFIDQLGLKIRDASNEILKVENEDSDKIENIVTILKKLEELLPIQLRIELKLINERITNKETLAVNTILAATSQEYQQPQYTQQYITPVKALIKSVLTDETINPSNLLFDKALRIKYALINLSKLQRETNLPNQKKLQAYYHANSESLIAALGQLNEKLYFTPATETFQKENTLLTVLQSILIPTTYQSFQPPITNLMKDAKEKIIWVQNLKLKNLKSKVIPKDQPQFRQIIDNAFEGKPVEKPHVLAFWKWPERHELFELDTNAKIYRIINDTKKSWQTKNNSINKLVDEYKPSLLQFWRLPERKRYEEMGAKANLICLVQAFTEGKMPEARFIAEIDKITPDLSKEDQVNLKQFREKMISAYQKHIQSVEVSLQQAQQNQAKNMSPNTKKAVTHLQVFKGTLEQEVLNIDNEGSNLFSSSAPSAYLFAGKTLNQTKASVSTNGLFGHTNAEPDAKQIKNRVIAEVKLERLRSNL